MFGQVLRERVPMERCIRPGKALLRNNCYILVHRLAIRGRKGNNHGRGYCLTASKDPVKTWLAVVL